MKIGNESVNLAELADKSDPVSVVLKCWDALGRCDFKGMERYLADDMVWQIMGCGFLPHGGRYVGKKMIVDDLLSLAGVLYSPATFRVDIQGVYPSGSHVTVEFVVNCVNHKGREYKDATYCNVFKVVDGKITKAREYVDSYKVKTVHVDD